MPHKEAGEQPSLKYSNLPPGVRDWGKGHTFEEEAEEASQR